MAAHLVVTGECNHGDRSAICKWYTRYIQLMAVTIPMVTFASYWNDDPSKAGLVLVEFRLGTDEGFLGLQWTLYQHADTC